MPVSVRRALISVSDKTGLEEFARGLAELGIEIISTGGTAKALKEAGVPVTPVSDVTGFPEILEGRVKTLHPAVHAGILARRESDEHMAELEGHNIESIDLVVVNLYPFKETVSRRGVSIEEALENIDIGGPTMIRAAAKNHKGVIVVVDPEEYGAVLQELRSYGDVSQERRLLLAAAAFRHTAFYDSVISEFLGRISKTTWRSFPSQLTLAFEKVNDLRYGENPHQKAAVYRDPLPRGVGLAGAQQIQGKELSYNNLNDAQAAWALALEFMVPAAVIVKHANPCGVAVAGNHLEAYMKAYNADTVSAFGGIVAFNGPVDKKIADAMKDVFFEVIIAPWFNPDALPVLSAKKNLRLIQVPDLDGARAALAVDMDLRRIAGGILIQESDALGVSSEEWNCVTKAQPEKIDHIELEFAWRVVKHVKSNAIVLARGGQTLGVGAGQMNRIDAARIAIQHTGEKAKGAYLASDAFFPFPDVVEAAADAGIRAIVQPGGSIKDEESIKMADEKGIIMIFTGTRHFKH